MTTMVVQAHPLADSYNAALLDHVTRALQVAGDEPDVFRLGEDERPSPEDLQGVDRLVLVYPTWWGGQPAVLLDWLQQMLTADAFSSVRRLQVATTHGSSRLINILQGEWGRRFLAGRVSTACAPGTGLEWHALYKIDRRSPDEITGFLTDTEALFSKSISKSISKSSGSALPG